jgi:hypothetical protein
LLIISFIVIGETLGCLPQPRQHAHWTCPQNLTLRPSQKWIEMELDKMRPIKADCFDTDSSRVVVKNLAAILAILSHHVNKSKN